MLSGRVARYVHVVRASVSSARRDDTLRALVVFARAPLGKALFLLSQAGLVTHA